MGAIAFLYPGTESFKAGMAKDFFNVFLPVRKLFEVAEKQTGLKLLKVCMYGAGSEAEPLVASQLAVFMADLAAVEALRHKRLGPQAQFGFGPGLYAALVAGGALEFTEALTLLKARAELMSVEEARQAGMMLQVANLPAKTAEPLIAESRQEGVLETAFLIGDRMRVLSGDNNAFKKFLTLLKSAGLPEVKAQPLPYKAAFHSSVLASGSPAMRSLLNGVKLRPLHMPTVCPATGRYFEGAEETLETLATEFFMPVEFEPAIQTMKRDGCFTMAETGPGTVMGQWTRRVDRSIRTLNVEDSKSLQNALKLVQ